MVAQRDRKELQQLVQRPLGTHLHWQAVVQQPVAPLQDLSLLQRDVQRADAERPLVELAKPPQLELWPTELRHEEPLSEPVEELTPPQ